MLCQAVNQTDRSATRSRSEKSETRKGHHGSPLQLVCLGCLALDPLGVEELGAGWTRTIRRSAYHVRLAGAQPETIRPRRSSRIEAGNCEDEAHSDSSLTELPIRFPAIASSACSIGAQTESILPVRDRCTTLVLTHQQRIGPTRWSISLGMR